MLIIGDFEIQTLKTNRIMLQDPNVERYVQERIEPLQEQIKEIQATIFKLMQANNLHLQNVSGSAVLRDKHGKEIFAGKKFRFKLMKELDEHIELLGSFDYNDEELRYEIDIWDNADYTCLSYIANGTMYDFELL